MLPRLGPTYLSGWLDWAEYSAGLGAGESSRYAGLWCELTPSVLTGRLMPTGAAPPVGYVRLSAVDEAEVDTPALQLLLSLDGGCTVVLTAPDTQSLQAWREGLQRALAEHSAGGVSPPLCHPSTPAPDPLPAPRQGEDVGGEGVGAGESGSGNSSAPSVASTAGTSPPHRHVRTPAPVVAPVELESGGYVGAAAPSPPASQGPSPIQWGGGGAHASSACPPVFPSARLAPPVDALLDPSPVSLPPSKALQPWVPLWAERRRSLVPRCPPPPTPRAHSPLRLSYASDADWRSPPARVRPPPPSPPHRTREGDDPLLCLCEPRRFLKWDARPSARGGGDAGPRPVFACLTLDGRHVVVVGEAVFMTRLRRAGLVDKEEWGGGAPHVALRSLRRARKFFGEEHCLAMPVENIRAVRIGGVHAREESTLPAGRSESLLCFMSRTHALLLEAEHSSEAVWLREKWSQLLNRR